MLRLYFSKSAFFAVHRSCFDSSKPICKMGLARLYWRTHPFSKVSESKLPTTKKKTQAAAQVLNCSTYWNLFNLCWVVNNYLFTFSTMVGSASRSCPIMRTQYDFLITCCVWDKPVLMCFGCKENLTSTLDYTTFHFVTTTRTLHTITLLCQIQVCLTVL